MQVTHIFRPMDVHSIGSKICAIDGLWCVMRPPKLSIT